MGYAALGIAALAFIAILMAGYRRSRRSWLERPRWHRYRDEVAVLGLDEREQRRLERSTRRGRPVPAGQRRAATAYAETVLAAQREQPARFHRTRFALAALAVLATVLQVLSLVVDPFSWTAVWGVVNGLVLVALLLLQPRVEARSRRLVRRSLDLARPQDERGAGQVGHRDGP